jgi:hypothetical protein
VWKSWRFGQYYLRTFKVWWAFLNEHLAHLFNLVIKYEFILKGGNKSTKYPNNYRGITLLPVILKLFENVIANRLPEIVDSDNFPCKQHMAYQK